MKMVLLTILSVLVLLILLTRIYQKLTLGICKSSAHMVGKVVIVTGGNCGLGFETAKILAERGARVIIACRRAQRAEEATNKIIKATGNKDVEYRLLDLSSFRSVEEFCSNILKTEKRLDVLINNAAASNLGNVKTEDGNCIGMQVNYFGPFLLTNLLLPLLKSSSPSRIVNVSSIIYKYAKLDFDNLNLEKYWSEYLAYANSKLYLNIMTVELSRRLQGTDVTVNTLHPGIAGTEFCREVITSDFIRCIGKRVIDLICKTVWEAAQTTIYLAVSPEVNGMSGRYFSDCKVQKPTKLMQDPEIAKRLWEETEKIVKLK